MVNKVIAAIKSGISKVYNWFNNPDKLEVIFTSYYVNKEDKKKPKVRRKRLTRMRVVKRRKEVK